MRVVTGELRRDEASQRASGRIAAPTRGYGCNGVIDRQRRERVDAGAQETCARGGPSPRHAPWQRRELRSLLQACERRVFGNMGHMLAEHALHECPIESRGGERPSVVSERNQSIRVDGFEQHRQPRCRRGDHSGQEERRIPVGHDDAGVAGQRGEELVPVSARGFDVRIVERPALGRVPLVDGHAIEDELMQPVVRARVVAAQRLEDHERLP